MATPAENAPEPRFGVLRTIAVYKIGKALILLLAAYGELRLHQASLSGSLLSWAAQKPYGLEHQLVTRGIAWFSGLSESQVHTLRMVTLSYAAIFVVEGVGLWMRKRWAEWLTTIITASLIPLEIWELYHRPNLGKVGVVIINSLIVAYLIWHVRARRSGDYKHEVEAGPPPGNL
jgi:uncharacterized membrane protein (DUF2068 family)